MKKKTLVVIFCTFMCLLILPISHIRGASFLLTDETSDVEHYVGSTKDDPGPNVHSEIDISALEIDGESLILTYVAAPLEIDNCTYSFRIFWIGDDSIGNWTKGNFGGLYNEVETRITDDTGVEILNQEIYGTITISGSTLIIPINNLTMIPQILDPSYVWIYAQFKVGGIESYQDKLIYDSNTLPFPGFTFWIAISGISLTVITGLLIKKKRNKLV